MSFKDIKGQDKPIQLLGEYIASSRLDGSYLFIGEEGIGKRSVAKTLAKAVNCENQTLDSCDKCVCANSQKGSYPDRGGASMRPVITRSHLHELKHITIRAISNFSFYVSSNNRTNQGFENL